MCRQGVNGSVLQVLRGLASGPPNGESFCSQPVSEPGHVAVAVERIGDQIERLERDQSIKSSRSHTGDLIGVQRQRLQVHQPVEYLFVDLLYRVLRQNTEKFMACDMLIFGEEYFQKAYISIILWAPSKAPSSMLEIWLRLKSTLSKLGNRLNNPKAGMEEIWLSFKSSLLVVLGKSMGISGTHIFIVRKLFFKLKFVTFEFSVGTIDGSTLAITLPWTIGVFGTSVFLCNGIVSCK